VISIALLSHRAWLQDCGLLVMEARGARPDSFLWHYVVQQHAWMGA